MRLFLSSYRIGNRPERLKDLLKGGTKVAVISNASDHHTEPGIIERIHRDVMDFSAIGLQAERLDLREYFDKDSASLYEKLKQYDLVWIRGGNVFNLRRAMRQSGFDDVITDMLAMDEIVYGGYSAGACVMAPTLLGIDLCDDAELIPDGYDSEIIWEGIGLVDFSIVPHYKSNHPESKKLDETVFFLEEQEIPFKTLHDGEALLIEDDHVELLS